MRLARVTGCLCFRRISPLRAFSTACNKIGSAVFGRHPSPWTSSCIAIDPAPTLMLPLLRRFACFAAVCSSVVYAMLSLSSHGGSVPGPSSLERSVKEDSVAHRPRCCGAVAWTRQGVGWGYLSIFDELQKAVTHTV